METLKGFTSESFPYHNLKKVSDLINYEGPLLSHFKGTDDDYLYLWVDNDDKANRWLVIPVEEKVLLDYLNKKLTLKEIAISSGDYLLFTDIDEKLNHAYNVLVSIESIPLDYLPSEKSYFDFPIPALYEELVKNHDYYYNLISNAVHVKVEESRFDTAVKVGNLMEVFKNFKSSLINYYEVNFRRDFKEEAFKKFDEVLQLILGETDYVLPRVQQGSFCASFTIDTLMSEALFSPEIKEWRVETFKKFKSEVFDIDYTKDAAINSLTEKYSEEERKAIYSPIIDTFKSSNTFKVSITDTSFKEVKKRFEPIPKNVKEKLVPKKKKKEVEEQDEQLLQIIAVTKGEGGKKEVVESTYMEEYVLRQAINDITVGKNQLFLKEPLEFKIQFNRGSYTIELSDFNVTAFGKSLAGVKKEFYERMIHLYYQLINTKDEELGVDQKEVKERFIELVSMAS